MSTTKDELLFADEALSTAGHQPPWRVLIVDDEPDVHAVTRLALEHACFEQRGVQLHHAHSAAEARALLATHADVALILLDVVMESDDAGLLLVDHVRETLGNREVRIVLRTGQPGVAPARTLIERYAIDDYRTKTELTSERLYVSVAAALRTYALLKALRQAHEQLQRHADAASHDLQTPLRAIVGFTQLLQRRHLATLDADGQALLNTVVDNGIALSALIRDLLENPSPLNAGSVARSQGK